VEKTLDIALPGTDVKRAWVIDVFNGTEQELNLDAANGAAVLKGILVKDYPVLIKLSV